MYHKKNITYLNKNKMQEEDEVEVLGKRSVFTVTTYVLDNLIPESETELISALKKFRNDLFNQAPEVMCTPFLWKRFINILNNQIPSREEKWQQDLQEYLLTGLHGQK